MTNETRRPAHLEPEPFLEIRGGTPLSGRVALPGAKNAALPAIVAACLSAEPTTLYNVPTGLNDVRKLIGLLRALNVSVQEPESGTLVCDGSGWRDRPLNGDQVGSLRHSLLLLGAAAYWGSELFLPMPGGCKLGSRKHDLHLLALRSFGFDVWEDEGIRLSPRRESQDETRISFYYPTFGGTLNVLFAACGKSGTTVLENAARNPEVLDVIALLRKMGADITWEEDTTLRVRGGTLRGAEHTVMGDRIIASTLIAATAVTKGHTFIRNATLKVLQAEAAVWREAGLTLVEQGGGVEVIAPERLRAVGIRTKAYPGFHTDIQPLHAAMMILAEGASHVEETILDGRFRYAEELRKMGANAEVRVGDFTCVNGAPGQVLHLQGVTRLRGAEVIATDIRGGAAVVVAGLAAAGTTRVWNLYQLERGYKDLHLLLAALGAQVERKVPEAVASN